MSKNHEFCIKNKELCIKNEELCIKNEELCIKYDEFRREKEKRELRKVASIIGQLNGGKGKKRKSQPMFTVEMVAARGLRRMDLVSSDPYAVVQCGASVQRTRTIRHTLAPEWNETVQFQIMNADSDTVSVQVFDEDFASKDQAMGEVDLDVKDFPQADEDIKDSWFALGPMVGCKEPMGEIRLKVSWQIKGAVLRSATFLLFFTVSRQFCDCFATVSRLIRVYF